MEYMNNLYEYRIFIHKSQEQLALEVGCTRPTISNIELGKNIPSIILAYKIAAQLQQPVTKIFPPDSYIGPSNNKEKEDEENTDDRT